MFNTRIDKMLVGMNTWRGTVTNLVTHAEYPSHINITFSGDPSDYAYFSGVGKDHVSFIFKSNLLWNPII